MSGEPLSVFLDGATHTVANKGLVCLADPVSTHGTDDFGGFQGIELRCTAGAGTPVVFSWRAHSGGGGGGQLMASLVLPLGASGTAAQAKFSVHETSPVHFAPFPAWRIEGAFNSSAFLCYGGDKSHLYSAHASSGGGGGIGDTAHIQTCFHLGNGPATMLWPTNNGGGGIQALVTGPASAFHLNYHRLSNGGGGTSARQLTAKLWYNAGRGDVTLCLSSDCDTTQTKSGYTLLSANEGTVNPSSIPPPGMPGGEGLAVPLFFSWSQVNKDNWVTNSSACPGPSYCANHGNPDGLIYCCAAKGRIALETFVNANGSHHIAAAKAHSKAWAVVHGYHSTGILGFLDSPPPMTDLCTTHAGVDYVCCDLHHVNASSPAECCAACKAAAPACSGWKTERHGGTCFLKTGELTNPVKVSDNVVVGYSHPPHDTPPSTNSAKVWTFGVSGDVQSVPAGFTQSTLLVHSPHGANAAWDQYGASIRAAHNTTKLADEDIFQTTLTLWTDNGAATLGAAWRASPGTKPPTVAPGPQGPRAHDLGPNISYMNWNWSMVSTEVYGKVADSVKATGVAPRGTQLDCWW